MVDVNSISFDHTKAAETEPHEDALWTWLPAILYSTNISVSMVKALIRTCPY